MRPGVLANSLGCARYKNQMPQFKKILCPVDFDENSLLALRIATELAREGKATLYLLHVVAMPPGPEVALPFGKMEAAARTRLEKLARQKIGGKARYEVDVMLGDPGVEVLRAANDGRKPDRSGDSWPEGTASSRPRKRG